MAQVIFKEEQSFQRWDVIAFLGMLIIGLIYGMYTGSIADNVALSPAVGSSCIVVLSFLMFYLLSIKMRVSISDKNISFQYYPLHYKKHKIKLHNIAHCAVVDNSFIQSFSGANLNFAVQEQMYSCNGRKGLEIVLKNRERIFIGSRNPQELKEVIENVLNKK